MTPIISIFHHPSNATSRTALELLQKKRAERPSAPAFEIEVNERRPPTAAQLETIAGYMKGGGSALLNEGVEPIQSLKELVKAVEKNPEIFRFPMVVHWEGGIATQTVDGVKSLIEKF